MPEMRSEASGGRWRLLLAVVLLASLTVCLTACRGFFGQAPIALLVVVSTTDQEVPVTAVFDISGSNDPDGTITSFVLNFGDSHTQSGSSVAGLISHTYMVAGAYTATLTVTDNDGRIGMAARPMVIGPAMLTFTSDRGAGPGTSFNVWRMKADGTDPLIVLNTTRDELFPDLVRGTRDKIAYSAENGTTWNIWSMTVDGLHASALTVQTQSNQLEPSWSRDGSKIAYTSNAAQTPSTTTWEIWTMTATGANQVKLTVQSPSWAIAPSYSPVNNDILFVSDKTGSGGSAIWLWDDSAAGTDKAVELYDSSAQDGAASPAGFPTGLGTALGLPAGMGISKPAWSPDGTKIAFSTDQGGNIDIYVINADGSSPKTLQAYVEGLLGQPAGTYPAVTTTDDEFAPYWLEDGTGLAFVKKVGSAYNLYKVSFSTAAVTQLTAAGSGANVSPAGKK